MSDFARLMELAMAANQGATMMALGEPPAEDAKDAPRRPAAPAAHPAPDHPAPTTRR